MIFNRAEDIIAKKERDGLRFQFFIRILANLIYLIMAVAAGTGTKTEIYLSTAVVLTFTMLNAGLLWFTYRWVTKPFFHLLGVIADTVYIIFLSYTLYSVMQQYNAPVSVLLKTDIFPITIVFLLFHMITLRPGTVLLSGILLGGVNIGILFLSVFMSNNSMTSDFSEGFTSYKVNPEFEAGKILIFFIIFALAYFISRRIRKTITDAAAAEAANAALSRYFSPEVSRKIAASGISLRPGGSIRKAAVLFSDIKDFTSISEKMSPEEVVQFLTEYHSLMVDIIFKNKGTLDKFIGDAVMAVFGVPENTEDDCGNAVTAAIQMQEALSHYNEERRKSGLFTVEHRIGIHYGDVLAGNIGTEQRMEYTVIGDTVNTASRIEQACRLKGKDLLISEEVFRSVKKADQLHPLFTDAGLTEIRGRSEPVRIYALNNETNGGQT